MAKYKGWCSNVYHLTLDYSWKRLDLRMPHGCMKWTVKNRLCSGNGLNDPVSSYSVGLFLTFNPYSIRFQLVQSDLNSGCAAAGAQPASKQVRISLDSLKTQVDFRALIQYKMSSYQYMKSHCGDKTVVRSSYLHNGISYIGKTSLYWISPLVKVKTTSKYIIPHQR